MISRPDAESPRHLRGFTQLATGQALARALTFVAFTYLARVLGVEMFGAIGFAAVVAAYVLIVVDAGLDLVAMRAIVVRESPAEHVVSGILTLRLGLAVVAAGVLYAVAPRLASSPTGLVIMLAYGLTLFSFAVNVKWAFQALEQYGVVATALALSQFAYLSGVLVFVRGPGDALAVPILLFGSELLGAIFLLVRYRREGFRLVPPSWSLPWRLLRDALPLMAARAVRAAAVNGDLLILGLIGTPRDVGLYAVLSRGMLLLRELAELYYLPMFPRLSQSARTSGAEFAAAGHTGLRYAAVIIFPVAVGGWLTGPDLLAFLFGREYVAAAPALSLLLAAMTVAMLTGPYRLGLVAYGRNVTVFWITTAGAILNVVLALLLVPRYATVGAAASVLGSETVFFLLAWHAMTRFVTLAPWRTTLRPAAAAAAMGVVVWALPALPFPVIVLIGAAAYGVLAVLVGGIRPRELLEAWRRSSSPTILAEP